MFSASLIIQKKRDGEELSSSEITSFIQGVTDGSIPDYQTSAFLMATYFQGMTDPETLSLTQALLASGERYELPTNSGPYIDKHSTGGVGDKVSLILAPLAAACGLKVPMMPGRGLGCTGGTLDKLESIPGFNILLSKDKFFQILNQVGCAIIGQSDRMVPADRKLYALRDVTATVECIPLLVSSILSKKLAEGAKGLVLDIKVGSGAFMKSLDQSRQLARSLVSVAKKMKLPCRVLLTNMNQPLGYAVGNSLEILECIEVLKNQKHALLSSADLRELTVQLCAHMLELGGLVSSLTQGRRLAHQRLTDGSAWKKFQELVRAQGGDLEAISQSPHMTFQAQTQTVWGAKKSGYISKIDTQAIGNLLIELGGGRKKVTDTVDPNVGFIFHKKLGNQVRQGEALVTVYSSSTSQYDLIQLQEWFDHAIAIGAARKTVPKLIFDQIL